MPLRCPCRRQAGGAGCPPPRLAWRALADRLVRWPGGGETRQYCTRAKLVSHLYCPCRQGGWWRRLSAAAFSMAGALIDKLVQWPGGPGLVQALLATPLRGVMARHYAATSDHARRLTSVEANAKFSSLDAGADTPCTVRLTSDFCTPVSGSGAMPAEVSASRTKHGAHIRRRAPATARGADMMSQAQWATEAVK